MTHATQTVDMMRPPFPAEPGAGVYSKKLGMWVFLASDVMFFTALIGSYIVLRFGAPGEWAKPGGVLNVPLTAFNTFLLICSSVSMVKAYAAIQDGKKYFLRPVPGKTLRDGGLKFWLLVTMLCGAAFVSVQLVEYFKLVHHGFTPAGFREGSLLAEEAARDPIKYGGAVAGPCGSRFFSLNRVPRVPRDLRRRQHDVSVLHQSAAREILAAGLRRHRSHRPLLALRRPRVDHP